MGNFLPKSLSSFYERNPFKNERTKTSQILIIHFNFIKEIPLKMNDIKKKLMHFNFIREIPLKLNRPKKIKYGEV